VIGGDHKRRLDIPSGYRTGVRNQFGKNRRVIARAAANVKHSVAGSNVSSRETARVKARLSIIDAFFRYERNDGILVQQCWVGRGCINVAVGCQNPPGPAPNEILAGHARECLTNSRIVDTWR